MKSLAVTAHASSGPWFAVEDPDVDPWFQAGASYSAAAGWDVEAEPQQGHFERQAWRHPISAAVSWLAKLLIDGFAACGEAMHPGYVIPPVDHDLWTRQATDTAGQSSRERYGFEIKRRDYD